MAGDKQNKELNTIQSGASNSSINGSPNRK